MQNNSGRLLLIDSLRGIAAVWVMLYHFYNALLPEKGYQLFWAPLDILFQYGFLGVYIFFVLSGFVINLSLRSKEMTGPFFIRFLFRRSIRLDIPYWTVIIVTGLSVLVMSLKGVSQLARYEFLDYVLNMLYLDNLVNSRSIVAVGWTLQYEIQFYLFFALLLYLFKQLRLQQLGYYILLLTFIASALYWFDWFPFYRKNLFLNYWFCFLLGAFVNDVIENRISIGQYLIAITLAFFHVLMWKDSAGAMAIATSVFLFLAGRFNGLNSWLNNRFLLFLGTISYSLYLLHPFLGNRIIRLINLKYDLSILSATVIFISVISITVVLVWLFYRLVEYPSHRLSKKITL